MAINIRYRAAFWAISSALIALACGFLLRNYTWGFGMRVALSLAPVLPMGIYSVLAIRVIRGLDELQARIYLEGALYGLFGSALLTMTAGLLMRSGVIPPVTLAGAWPWLWTAAFLLWGAGTFAAASRYR